MRGMIVAAGLGTRLRPLTELCPKPALPVRGVPLIAYNLRLLAAAGVDEVVINTHHLPAILEREARAWCPSGVTLRFSYERELLDTGGGIRRVVDFLRESDPAIVIGGDMLIDFDLEVLLAAHRQSGAAISTLLLDDPRASRFGTIGIDDDGRVRRIANRFRARGAPETRCGLYTWVNVFRPESYDYMPERDRFSHFDAWWIPVIEADPDAVRGSLVSRDTCRWEPVGTPEEYLQVNFDVPPPAFFDVAAEAARTGATLRPGRVVGRDCTVAGEANLERVVVWDGQQVPPGRYRDGVFADGRFIPLLEAPGGAA